MTTRERGSAAIVTLYFSCYGMSCGIKVLVGPSHARVLNLLTYSFSWFDWFPLNVVQCLKLCCWVCCIFSVSVNVLLSWRCGLLRLQCFIGEMWALILSYKSSIAIDVRHHFRAMQHVLFEMKFLTCHFNSAARKGPPWCIYKEI